MAVYTLSEEKKVVLEMITDHAKAMINDPNVLTHDMLVAIKEKCQELIISDF